MKRLVVVESPTKARTIRNFLPSGEYQVEASMGHVRDLPSSASEIPESLKKEPWSRLGVNTADAFEPIYIIPSDKKKVVRELRSALKGADELYIATDEDREGESIGWHLLEVLQPKIPVRRMVFHEITREAILEALERTRDIDTHLVEAQETRRILDRLVGYTISPLLWRKIAPRLSAGRVQSVAVRLLVLRETERILFVPASYWDLKAQLEQDKKPFESAMTHFADVRLVSGKSDFDDETGKLKKGLTAIPFDSLVSGSFDPSKVKGKPVLLLGEKDARALAERLPKKPWRVVKVEEKTQMRSPAPPFITSTLQQEASRKLNLSAKQTMRTAQQLYENGHITYMRTDSTNLSKEAIEAARRAVQERYGKNYLSQQPRQYSGKVRNAQEAHEAIRPAGKGMETREEKGLSGVEGKLYDLIWKRTVASQMAKARLLFTTATIEAGEDDEAKATFRSSGRRVEFAGFFRAYVEGSDDPEAAIEDRDQPLPPLKEGDTPDCKSVEPLGHETKPPARYTEASLVKTLEGEGIGRPSTYASIMDTIVNRGYVRKQGSQLVPTFTAFAANNLMERQFDQLVDVGFTAGMEQVLDDIAEGGTEAIPYLRDFYNGTTGLETKVETGLDRLDAREVSSISFSKWNGYVVRVGKYGPYVEGEIDGERVTASLPDELAPADVDEATLEELLKSGNVDDQVLGIHPDADQPVLLKKGPYGPYVQLGDDDQAGKPKRMSLPKGVEPADVDLQMALDLLNLPRALGDHPESGQPIKASIGRYGPYVQHGSTFASLKKEDDLFTVGLDRALELILEKEAKRKPLRVIGQHPESGDPVEVWSGKYGPYVKHKRTNASLPKDRAPEAVTMEEALSLLAARQASKKKKSGGEKTTGKRGKKTPKAKK